jgi:hypothetical protein
MNPPAQLSTACRAGVNKEVEYFFKMGLRPNPGRLDRRLRRRSSRWLVLVW